MLDRFARFCYRRLLPVPAQNAVRVWLMLDKADAHPEPIESFAEERVLVLAPHPDDEVIGCGGTIRKHVLAGSRVTVAFMTDGRAGSLALCRNAEELAVMRKKEAQAAAAVLGVHELVFLDGPDGALNDTPPMIQKTKGLLLAVRPALLYLPSMMDLLHDHWATNRIVAGALETGAALLCRQYEVWTPLPANRVADITDTCDAKRNALREYASQLVETDYLRAAEALNAYRAIHSQRGRGLAEAFRECTNGEFLALYRRVTAKSALP